MSLYPKAVEYLKRASAENKLTKIYKLDLLETVLKLRDFEDYISIKEKIKNYGGGHIRVFDLLFSEWLKNSISDVNLNVYKGIYSEGQDIRYFRDYFNNSNEEITNNSKGTLIEFKAYGDSLKINREVIAFEGRFYDNILTSYTDKTSQSNEYLSVYHTNTDIDFYLNDIPMIKDLITNKCLDIVDNTHLENIICRHMNSVLLNLIINNNHKHLISSKIIRKIEEDDELVTELFSLLLHNNEKEFLKEVISNEMIGNKIPFEALKLLFEHKSANLMPDKIMSVVISNNMSSKVLSFVFDNNLFHLLNDKAVRATIEKSLLTELIDGLIKNNKKDVLKDVVYKSIFPEEINMSQLLFITKHNCLEGLSKDFYEQVITSDLSGLQNEIEKIGNLIKSKAFYYDNNNMDFMLSVYDYYSEGKQMGLPENPISYTTKFDNLGTKLNSNTNCYRLKDIIQYFKNKIEKNYIFNPNYESKSWDKEMIERLKPYTKGDSDKHLFDQLEQIRKAGVNRVSESYSKNRNNKIKTLIKKIVIVAIIAGVGYWIWTIIQNPKRDDISSLTSNNTTLSDSLQSIAPSFPVNPGKYYVSEEAIDGVTLYKDVKKKNKLSYRLSNMENISIAKVEDSMGFFEYFFNENYDKIPQGWVELKYLKPLKGSVYDLGDGYRVRSDQEKISIYKDYFKKNKLKFTMQSMDKLNVIKIVGGMAYSKNIYINATKVKGWVELTQIEKIQ